MMHDMHRLIAFLSVVGAIVALALIGGTGSDLAIMTGLIGVLGTFQPRSNGVSEETAKTLTEKIPPVTGEPE